MVVEYIRYTVSAAQAEAFEEAYGKAGAILEQDPHCLAFEVARGVEEPEHFVVRPEWDSLDGFRASSGSPSSLLRYDRVQATSTK